MKHESCQPPVVVATLATLLFSALFSAQALANGCEDLADPDLLGPGNALVEAGVGTVGASGGAFNLQIP